MRRILLILSLSLLVTSNVIASTQVFYGYHTGGFGNTEYDIYLGEATGCCASNYVLTNGSYANLKVFVTVAPGGVASKQYSVRINGTNSSLTCTITGAATSCSDTTHSASITSGDLVNLRTDPSGSPSNGDTKFSVEFTPTTSGTNIGGVFIISSPNNSTTSCSSIFSRKNWTTTCPGSMPVPMSISGTITSLKILQASNSGTGGSGKKFVYNLVKNGTVQDGTGGTVDTTITILDANNTSTGSFSLAFVPGDLIYLQAVPTSTPASGGTQTYAYTYTSSTSQLCFASDTTVSGSTQYSLFFGAPDISSWNGTEANRQFIGSVTTKTYTGLYLWISGLPGAGKTYTLDMRNGSASPSGTPSVTITNASQSSNANGTFTLANGDLWDIRSVPSGSPSAGFINGCLAEQDNSSHLLPVMGVGK